MSFRINGIDHAFKIVGIVADAYQRSFGMSPAPALYVVQDQLPEPHGVVSHATRVVPMLVLKQG